MGIWVGWVVPGDWWCLPLAWKQGHLVVVSSSPAAVPGLTSWKEIHPLVSKRVTSQTPTLVGPS